MTRRFESALQRLARRHPGAAAVLNALAVLAPAPFPLRASPYQGEESGGLPRTQAAVGQALAVLDRYALAEVCDGLLTPYRLTRTLVREQAERGALPAIRADARALLIAADPGPVSDPATWTTWARLLPHLLVADVAVLNGSRAHDLAREACWFAMDRGDHATALARLDELHRSWSEELGPDHPDTWRTMTYLARAADGVGDPARARTLIADVHTRRRRVLGPDHPDTLLAAHSIAARLAMAGRERDALRLADEVLARRRRLLGPTHPDTVAAHETVAAIERALAGGTG